MLYPAELPGRYSAEMHIVTKRETGGQSCVRANVLFVLAKRFSIRASGPIATAAFMKPERCFGIRSSACVGLEY